MPLVIALDRRRDSRRPWPPIARFDACPRPGRGLLVQNDGAVQHPQCELGTSTPRAWPRQSPHDRRRSVVALIPGGLDGWHRPGLAPE